jgi:hypothetical protein
MKPQNFLVYSNVNDNRHFRIIDNPTNKWTDVKIIGLKFKNFKVQKVTIAEDDSMNMFGEGRTVFSETRSETQCWKDVNDEKVFEPIKMCYYCSKNNCPEECENIEKLLSI